MTFLFTRFISPHFLPVKSSRKLSILVIIINGYSFGQLLVIYKVPENDQGKPHAKPVSSPCRGIAEMAYSMTIFNS